MYRIVESVCCMPEMNIRLYGNYTSIKNKEFTKRNEKKHHKPEDIL